MYAQPKPASAAPCAQPKPTPAVLSVAVVVPSASKPIDPEKSLKAWLKKVDATDDDSWVKLATFLKHVKEPAQQPKRYVDGKSKKTWMLGPRKNRLPKLKKDWDYMKTSQGGGAGDSLLHVRVSFLKEVCMAYYKHRV